jgi:hypothetical protein
VECFSLGALHIAFDHNVDQKEVFNKLFQAYDRLSSMHDFNILPQDTTKWMDLIRKRRTKMQETRVNMNFQLSNKPVDTCLKWITERFTSSFKEAVEDSFKLIKGPPCGYCFIALSGLSRNEATPSSTLEFALLIDVGFIAQILMFYVTHWFEVFSVIRVAVMFI